MLRGLVHSRQLLAHHFETSLTSLFSLSLQLAYSFLLRLHVTYYELFILLLFCFVARCEVAVKTSKSDF